MSPNFWKGHKVFVTRLTGFKGAWLTLWLRKLGANVTGFSLAPPTQPNFFEAAKVADGITSIHGDIRDNDGFPKALFDSTASGVFHLAAQATVADGYKFAHNTFATNVTGTVILLDAQRDCPATEAVVIVTSPLDYVADKISEFFGGGF